MAPDSGNRKKKSNAALRPKATSDAELMQARMEKAREETQGLAGFPGLGVLLVLLAKALCWDVPAKQIFFGVLVSCAFLRWWSMLIGLCIGGLLAIRATWKKQPRPPGIPLAPMALDVMLGRPRQASKSVKGLHSNNNVTITTFKGRYLLAYRQSDYHFPSEKTQVVLVSSTDLETWTTEWTFSNGNDLREVLLFEMHGKLVLYFFSLLPVHFKPLHVFYTSSADGSNWDPPAQVCYDGEVPWEIKVYGSGDQTMAYKSSYLGDHYGTGDLLVLFEQSKDGVHWEPVPPCTDSSRSVYKGGVCEVSFEFTPSGDLVAIGRNEDGDSTGFGTQLFFASKGQLGRWTPLKISIPYRFDSPRLVSMESGEILLFGRYAQCPYQYAPAWLPFAYQKVFNLLFYSCVPKSAAVYRLAPQTDWSEGGEGMVQLIRQFEGSAGDTGFFSVVRDLGAKPTSPDSWVVANYTSVSCHTHAPWLYGQLTPSHIFVFTCKASDSGAPRKEAPK